MRQRIGISPILVSKTFLDYSTVVFVVTRWTLILFHCFFNTHVDLLESWKMIKKFVLVQEKLSGKSKLSLDLPNLVCKTNKHFRGMRNSEIGFMRREEGFILQ